MTEEQKQAYDRYVRARNYVGIMKRSKTWIRHADVVETVDDASLNHPLFLMNDDWLNYKEAFEAWLAVEPVERKDERMRMSRGDYGTQDSWDEKGSKISDVYNKVKGL